MLIKALRGLTVAVLALAWTGTSAALTVFACEPEWAALVRVLWPEARVHVATHVGQDPHHIEARPALIAQLRQADLVVCTGAELEAGWVPVTMSSSSTRSQRAPVAPGPAIYMPMAIRISIWIRAICCPCWMR